MYLSLSEIVSIQRLLSLSRMPIRQPVGIKGKIANPREKQQTASTDNRLKDILAHGAGRISRKNGEFYCLGAGFVNFSMPFIASSGGGEGAALGLQPNTPATTVNRTVHNTVRANTFMAIRLL